MGSQVSTFHSVITMQVSLLVLLAMLGITTASTWQAAPYTLFREKRAAQRTRFFTGNNAIDAGAAGAALGVATQYFTNQIFNPCTRGVTGEVPGLVLRAQTTEYSEDRLYKMELLALPLGLLELLWLMLLLETLVDDKYVRIIERAYSK